MIDFDAARTLAQQYYDNGAATFNIEAFAPFQAGIKNDINHRTMLVILLVTTVPAQSFLKRPNNQIMPAFD